LFATRVGVKLPLAMAFPGNPSKGSAGFENAPLTPDDYERLATAFRPSWELDEAPFTGAGALSPTDIRALQGGGTHADVRAAALGGLGGVGGATGNGAHPPPKPTVMVDEPSTKVIVDITSAPPPTVQVAAERPRVVASPGPWVAASGAEVAAAVAPQPQSKVITVRPPRPAFQSDAAYPKPGSKTGLWAAIGGAAVLVVGGVVWLASGSSESAEKAAQPATTQKVQDRTASIPPPPPEPVVAAVPVQAPASPPVVAATSLPPAPAMANLPSPSRPVVMNAPAPHPVSNPTPAPKPPTASRPKGPTIVRDVPF
jgi:hypothetical protein